MLMIGSIKRFPLIQSGLIHASNLFTGVIVLICCVFFFGWKDYGYISLVVSFSLLSTQVSVLGNPGLMIALLVKADHIEKNLILNAFLRNIRLPNLLVIIGILGILCLRVTMDVIFSLSFPVEMVVGILVYSLFAPFNKMVLSALTLPDTYKSYMHLLIFKNVLIVLLILLSVSSNSVVLLFLSFSLAELLIFPFVKFLKHRHFRVKHQLPKTHIDAGIVKQVPVLAVTLYYELLAKFDFYVFAALMSPNTFGLYALISNVNESIHGYLASVRTQVTPHFTDKSELPIFSKLERLEVVKLILTAQIIVGFVFIAIIYRLREGDLNFWTTLYILLTASTLVMIKTLVFGGVYIQRNQTLVFSRFAILHLFILSGICFTVAWALNPISALVAAILVNLFASRLLTSNLPIGSKSV